MKLVMLLLSMMVLMPVAPGMAAGVFGPDARSDDCRGRRFFRRQCLEHSIDDLLFYFLSWRLPDLHRQR